MECAVCLGECSRAEDDVYALRCGRCGQCHLHPGCHSDYMRTVKKNKASKAGACAKVGFVCPKPHCKGIIRATTVLSKASAPASGSAPTAGAERKGRKKRQLPTLNTRYTPPPPRKIHPPSPQPEPQPQPQPQP